MNARTAPSTRLTALPPTGDFACDAMTWFVSGTGTSSEGNNVLDAYPGVPIVCLMGGGSLRWVVLCVSVQGNA